MTLLLTKHQIRSLLSMRECIDAVEDAFRELANGTAKMPQRISLSVPSHDAWFAVMPAFLQRAESLTTKIVSVYPHNLKAHRIPNVLAVILLNDVSTGRVEAVMEGSEITAMRTGAVSGLATKYLARVSATHVGVFGAGVQARKQLEAVLQVRKISSALVYDTNKELAKEFAQGTAAQTGIPVSVACDSDEVVRNSDIIATATTSSTPVFNGHLLQLGTHINAIGAYTPTTRELDSETVSSCKIVVDSTEAALEEAGDIIIPLKQGLIQREGIWAELGEIVTGSKEGRTSEEEKTLFK